MALGFKYHLQHIMMIANNLKGVDRANIGGQKCPANFQKLFDIVNWRMYLNDFFTDGVKRV